MVQPIRWLDELSTKGGAIKAVCQQCGRAAYFDPGELLRYYRRRNWNRSWPAFAAKLRCKPPAGCGAHGPTVDWVPDPPPRNDDPIPPRPRFARAASMPFGADSADHVGRRLRVVKKRAA